MTGPEIERLISLRAADRRGSGYLLTPEAALTAGHCVGPEGSTVEVRKYSRTNGRYDLPQAHAFRVVVRETGELDFALLESTSRAPFEPESGGRCGPVRLGRLVGEKAVPAQALGFPRSGVAQAGAKRLVNPEDVRGQVLPQSGLRHRVRCLNLQIETGSPPVTGGHVAVERDVGCGPLQQ
ncbi:hypothetical protein ACFQ9Z_15840 [Streptomyces sp. NPDC056580]|uniref:hypothetical protein n=1 Tax=Streptomyces sp. NPDC056580 TaxID=3345872 RepID=UPI0036C03D68